MDFDYFCMFRNLWQTREHPCCTQTWSPLPPPSPVLPPYFPSTSPVLPPRFPSTSPVLPLPFPCTPLYFLVLPLMHVSVGDVKIMHNACIGCIGCASCICHSCFQGSRIWLQSAGRATMPGLWPSRSSIPKENVAAPQPARHDLASRSSRQENVAAPQPSRHAPASHVHSRKRARASLSRAPAASSSPDPSLRTVSFGALLNEHACSIPLPLKAYMAQWGPELRRAMEKEAARYGYQLSPPNDLRIGTDCAGLEAPVLSLQAMKFLFIHVFSCDVNPKVRQFIKANWPGVPVFEDMLKRNHSDLPWIQLYLCGFPCTPFSSLHTKSKLFREAAARPFFAMVRTLRTCLPALAILENVLGLLKVLKKVWRILHSIGWYEVLTFLLDPQDMGEPCSRPRVYIVLVRCDVAVRGLDELAGRLLNVGLRPQRASLSRLLLPSTSPLVTRTVKQSRVHPGRSRASSRGEPSWQAQHRGLPTVRLSRPVAGLTDRERSLLGCLLARQGLRDLSADVNPDVSQSLSRTRGKAVCPTVTPGGRIVIGQQRRVLAPIEKCLVHLVPVHELSWPETLTQSDVAQLGGNTMHLMAVARSASPRSVCN